MLKKLVIGFASVFFVLTSLLGFWFIQCNSFLDDTVVNRTITVKKGESFADTYQNVIGDLAPPFMFKKYLIKVAHFHQTRKYGYYVAEKRSLREVIDMINSGKQHLIKITFPEGFSIADIAKRAEAVLKIPQNETLQLSKNKQFIKKQLQADYETLEGFLYPDTYLVPPNSTEQLLLKMMIQNFKKNVPSDFEYQLSQKGLSYYDGIILASIIQKESYKKSEHPIIASVFYNRLKYRMRLQSDPTVIYGIKDYNGNIKKKHLLDRSNPYNTYKHGGLPPTPIANPSADVLKAVAHPDTTKFLYFVADKDGGHIFSKNYKTHRKNVSNYLRKR